MSDTLSPGAVLRDLVRRNAPLQIAGTINAYCALLAQQAGFEAIYLSGAGVANASFGMPDLGQTRRCDVVEDAKRITGAVEIPLLIDVDTGWEAEVGGMGRTVLELCKAHVAGCHTEDQIADKRCGHRPGKRLVNATIMNDRIKAAVDARTDENFVVMARTDAYGVEGHQSAIDRAGQYVDAGADMIFAEAMTNIDEYSAFCKSVSVPVLANMTEFGLTPLFSLSQLGDAGVGLALYPLSAFRAMSAAAMRVYETLKSEGTQASVLDQMQTREQLYDVLNYYERERHVDEFLSKGGADDER